MPAQNFSKTEPVTWLYWDPINTTAPVQYVSQVTTRTKSQTGSFPAKKPKPLPVSTPYSTRDYRCTTARYDEDIIAKSGLPSQSRRYTGVPVDLLASLDVSHNGDKYNEAIVKLNSALLEGKWESGVFLGELRETMAIWSACAEAVGNFLGSIRKGKKGNFSASWRGIRKSAESISTLWLLYRYGIMPLVHDVQDAVDLLCNKISTYDSRCSVKSPKTKSTTVVTRALNPGTVETISQTKIWFKAWFDPPSSYKSLMQRFASQFGLTNPFSIAWELLTLSFVIDWLIDVGGYLEALSQPQGFTIYTVESNWFTKATMTIDPNGTYRNVLGDTLIMKGQKCQKDLVLYNRSQGGYPRPRIPTFDPQMTAKRLFDAMALLTGNYDRVKRFLR